MFQQSSKNASVFEDKGMWAKDVYIYIHPRKINMEHNNEGLEDHFPFQMDDL